MSETSYRLIMALVTAGVLAALHAEQIPMLSKSSLLEFWQRADTKARKSKILFLLSLASCLLTVISYAAALLCAGCLFFAHGLLAMRRAA